MEISTLVFSFVEFVCLFRREGCTTDQVLANVRKKIDSIEELDGFDVLRYYLLSNFGKLELTGYLVRKIRLR
jgi:hypothetical protein